MLAVPRRWVVLAVGVLAQTASCAFVYGVTFLVPTLRDELGLSLAGAVLVAARDPERPAEGDGTPTGSPYGSAVLWRVHAASALLVVPQFAFSAFGAEYLVRRQGWGVAAAGAFLAVVQIAGALSRIASGVWSDRVGSRLRPMRQLAVAAALVVLVFALGDAVAPWLAVTALVAGGIVTVADNGLAFTAVAEIAGPFWSGRALGIQNTGQNIVSSLTPVGLGVIIGISSYAVGFVAAAVAPLVAVAVTPVRDERPSAW